MQQTNKSADLCCTEVLLSEGMQAPKNGKCTVQNAVNLSFSGSCTTRSARQPVQVLTAEPDEIIPAAGKLYYRYGNTLRTVTQQNGELAFTGQEIALLPGCSGKNRSVIRYGQQLYIFPDNITIHENSQTLPFAAANTVAQKFPFTGSTTLFYKVPTEGEALACADADLLTQYATLRFSFSNTEHTVLKREQVYSVQNGVTTYQGVQITLSPAVPNYNSIPAGATATLQTPYCHPIQTIYYGNPNCSYSLFENTLTLQQPVGTKKFEDSFKNYFSPGQVVCLKGTGSNALGGQYTLQTVEDDTLTFTESFNTLYSFSGQGFSVQSLMPQADFAVMNDERCILADNENHAVWLSAHRNPARYMLQPQLATDGCKLTVAGAGNFTALFLSGGEVYIFTAEGAFRLYGSNALNYQAAAINSSGVSAEFSRSLCGQEKQFFYCTGPQIVKYRSGNCRAVSAGILANPQAKRAVACGGLCYFLGKNRLYIYSPAGGKWWTEDADGIGEIFSLNNTLYLLSNGVVYAGGGSLPVSWQLQTGCITGQMLGSRVVPVGARLLLESGSGCKITARQPGENGCGAYRTVRGRQFLQFPLNSTPVQELALQLSGEGPATLLRLQILYRRLLEC